MLASSHDDMEWLCGGWDGGVGRGTDRRVLTTTLMLCLARAISYYTIHIITTMSSVTDKVTIIPTTIMVHTKTTEKYHHPTSNSIAFNTILRAIIKWIHA